MKILICGDFATEMRGSEAINKGKALSRSVRSMIDEHNATIINLEAPIAPLGAKRITKLGPCLKCSPLTTEYLKSCGVNAVTLANNHFYDYGEDGVKETMVSMQKNGILTVGGGRNESEKSTPLLLKESGDNICVLNYCESEFSIGHKMGSNRLNPIKVFYDLKEAVSKNYYTIVVVHGGHEGCYLPSPRMKLLYRYFIDCGANVVINHHQHCYSGYETYHKGLIFYGLGNFFFDSPFKIVGKGWNEGYMVGLNIEKGILLDYKIYPYYQCKDDIIETRLMAEKDISSFWENINKINHIIEDDKVLQKKFDAFCETKSNLELACFTPYSSRILQYLYRRKLLPSFMSKKKRMQILNKMRCESHRDVCIHLLSDKTSEE